MRRTGTWEAIIIAQLSCKAAHVMSFGHMDITEELGSWALRTSLEVNPLNVGCFDHSGRPRYA